jgi:FtsZ-interacting cell division protein ZipA
MSDLQLGLAVIGVIVIVAVIAYNKWQERRLSQHAERDFGSRHEDVLVQRSAAPEEAAPASAAPIGPAIEHERVEHTIGEPALDEAPSAAAPARAAPAPATAGHVVLDPAIDAIVGLECARPVAGLDALEKAQALLDEGLVKPVHWEGYDAAIEAWGPLHADRRYELLRVGLQLANREGPAGEEDLGAFLTGVQEVALALAAEPVFPEPEEMIQQARLLDGFAAEVDVQIGLNVISTATQPFAGTKLRALAEANGMQLGRDGRYHRFDDHGNELFALANSEPMPFHGETLKGLSTHAVTVLLDVPRAPGSSSTFRLYLDFARQLEQSLGGMLVDDNKRPIGQAALDSIGRQLETIYDAMDARGIPAGSAAARRLFS